MDDKLPPDDQSTRAARQVSPESFIQAMPLPSAASNKPDWKPEFRKVPAEPTRASSLPDVPWQVILSPADKAGEYIALEIQGDVTLGASETDHDDLHVNLWEWAGDERSVSRRHVAFRPGKQQLFVLDLGSTNHTHINGTLLTTDRVLPLVDGDLITLGRLHLRVKLAGGPGITAGEG